MQFLRKIIESRQLEGVLDVPEELKGKKVELIILPVEDECSTLPEKDQENWFGSFSLVGEDENKSSVGFAFKSQGEVVLKDEG